MSPPCVPSSLVQSMNFGELEEETSTYADSNEQSELLQITQTDEPHCTILEDCTNVDTNNSS